MSRRSILEYIYLAHRHLSELETSPRDYGTGEALFASEIHTLAAVALKPGCNLTTLAMELEVSKPAASKFVTKLIQSGYLTKQMPTSGRDIQIELTDKGRRAARGHEVFERRTFGLLREAEQSLDPESSEVIVNFLDRLSRLLKKRASSP
jgi:DNA-binding MarR family transcriptional regulator